MMSKIKSHPISYLKLLAFLPIAAGLILVFACKKSDEQKTQVNDKTYVPNKQLDSNEMAQPLTGWKEMYAFIDKNLKYPEEARENHIIGTVHVSFDVEHDGRLANFKVENARLVGTNHEHIPKMGYGCDEEALRIAKLLPPWKPASSKGKFVRHRVLLPFLFGDRQKIYNDDKINSVEFSRKEISKNYSAKLNNGKAKPTTMQNPLLKEEKGDIAMYVGKRIKYPEDARKNNITGRVIAQFTVNKTGKTQDVKIIEGIGHGCDEEVIRLIKELPAFKPGNIDGELTDMKLTNTVMFKLK